MSNEKTSLDRCVEVCQKRKTLLSETEFCDLAAQAINECVKGLGTEEQKLALLLSTIANLHERIMLQVMASYTRQYRRDMFSDLKEELPMFVAKQNLLAGKAITGGKA